MKRICLYLFLFLTIPFSLFSQTRTVGTTGADYSTLKSAFDAINAGTLTGNIVLQIIDNTTEAGFSAQINASGTGAANYTSVNIYPTVTGKTISGNMNQALINMNGADNVTIDGRLNATGSTIDLTITNTSISSAGVTSTIYFQNQATSNTIKYCNLKGSTTSTNSGIIFFHLSANPLGNNNNTIDHNNITSDAAGRPVNAIFSLGTSGKSNTGNIISNNNIYDFLRNALVSSNGIKISTNNTQWTISDNSFYETSPSFVPAAHVTYMIIYINYGTGSGFNVSGNYIGGRAPLCAGSPWTKRNDFNNQFFGIYMNAGDVTPNSIQDNTIKNFNWSNSGGAEWTAIYLFAGTSNVGNSIGNTIGATSGTGSISLTGGANANMYGIRIQTTGTVECQNNTIGSITTSNASSFAFNIYGIYKISTVGTTNILNNVIGSTITANSISASSPSTGNIQDVIGIRNDGSGDNTISGNTICNLLNEITNSSGKISGFELTGSPDGSNNFSRNFIHSLYTANAANTATVNGIKINSGNSTIANNIVSLDGNTSSAIYGVYSEGASDITNVYFNTVYIEGNPTSGSLNSYALFSNADAGTQDFRNNIFSNARSNSGATGSHYAVSLAAASIATIDYNDYYAPGTGGVLGFLGSDQASLENWQLATGQDGGSFNIDPVFNSPGSSTATDYKIGAVLTGIDGTGITNDFGNNSRGVSPTMGAWESIINKWKGSLSTSWANTSNWTAGVVPDIDANIIFDAAPNNDCVLDQPRSVTDITNESVRNLLLAGNVLTLKGNLYFTGSGRINAFAAGSGIIYSGSSAQTIETNQFLSDSIYNLTIANLSGVTLNSNLKISNSLTINPTSIANIAAGKNATVSGATANNGTLNLRSAPFGTASLITATASGSSNNIERYVTGGGVATDPSHLISSPVSNQNITSFLSGSGAVMRYHNDVTGLWVNGSPGGNFVQGTGYAVRKTSTGLLSFSGTLNTPPVTRALIFNEQNFGWNCVGNPFASTLNVNNFLTGNSSVINNGSFFSCYVYRKNQNPLFLPVSTGYLQSGQGFFVKSAEPASGSLSFTLAMQTHQNPVFYKKSGNETDQKITLHVKNNTDSTYTNVYFYEEMTKGLDARFDVGIFGGKPEFTLYTKLIEDNGINFFNQYLPEQETSEMIVPVGFDFAAGGLVTFTADITSLPVGYTAILEDRLLETFTDLKIHNVKYEVAVAAGTAGTGRFFIHTVEGPNSIYLQELKNINTFAVKKEIFIKGMLSDNATAAVYDLLGRKIADFKLEPSEMNILKVSSFKEGIYIVKVSDKGVLKTDRVYISE